MKKFVTIYIVISFLIGFGIFYVTKTLMNNQRVYDVYYELAEKAVETKNFDEFISMQSVAYKKLYTQTTDDYLLEGYLVIGRSGKKNINQLGIFVVPTKDVKHAEQIDDQYDKTGLRVINNLTSETFYETYTDDNYKDASISYGLTLMDFYFYAINIEKTIDLKIELYDYEEKLISTYNQMITYQNYPDLEDGFTDGMDPKDLELMIDFDTFVTPKIIKNMTLFIVIDIAIGTGLYFIIKKKKKL